MSLKTSFTNSKGYKSAVQTSGNWYNAFGGNVDSWYKGFTTQVDYSGVARYLVPRTINNSGFANASGLNPYGNNTLGEGIIHGTTPNPSSFVTINPTGVRHYGYKNPANFVGWGFDIHGQPYPNANSGYNLSGMYGTVTPTGLFHGASGLNLENNFASPRGSDVPPERFFAGPLDLRIDPYRGVWTVPFGVMPCVVENATVGGSTATGAYIANTIRYNVRLEDGEANKLTLTGIPNYGPHFNATYLVQALPTGSRAFLMNATISGMPRIVLWASEPLAVSGCGADETILPIIGKSPNVAMDEDTFPNYFIMGSGERTITSKEFIPGTGISVSYTDTTWTINLSGTATVVAGVNSNIQMLSGLNVPLSISQGGTGASGISFVALTGNQTTSGIKIWQNSQRFANGTTANPAISFNSGNNFGLCYSSTTGMFAVGSGNIAFGVSANGTYFYNVATFRNISATGGPTLIVQETLGGSDVSFVVRDSSGFTHFSAGTSGCRIYAPSGSTTITIPIQTSGSNILTLPSGGTVVNTSYLQQSFVWNEVPSGLVNGVNANFGLARTPLTSGTVMVFRNGMLQAYGTSEDYTISGTTITFTTGSIPNSGVDKLRVSYQAMVSY